MLQPANCSGSRSYRKDLKECEDAAQQLGLNSTVQRACNKEAMAWCHVYWNNGPQVWWNGCSTSDTLNRQAICKGGFPAIALDCDSADGMSDSMRVVRHFSTPLPTCAASDSEFPVGVHGEVLEGSFEWQVVSASLFDGDFSAKGPQSGARGQPRPKPKLLKFKAKQFEQRPECKTLTFSGYESLSDDNPCKYVSGPPTKTREEATEAQEQGQASFMEGDYDEDMAKGPQRSKAGQGYTYANIFGCFKREFNRQRSYEQTELGWTAGASTAQAFLKLTVRNGCAFIPGLILAPFGAGVEGETGHDLCEYLTDAAGDTITAAKDLKLLVAKKEWWGSLADNVHMQQPLQVQLSPLLQHHEQSRSLNPPTQENK